MSIAASPTVRLLVPDGWRPERDYVARQVLGEWLGLAYRLEVQVRPNVRLERLDAVGLPAVTMPDVLFAHPDGDWAASRLDGATPAPRLGVPPGFDARGDRTPEPVPVPFGVLAEDGLAWSEKDGDIALRADVFGSVFALLARLEEVERGPRDAYDRFPTKASWAVAEEVVGRPVVDDLVDLLWLALRAAWPDLCRHEGPFQLCLTHDIDRPWSTLGRPARVIGRSIAADLLIRRDPRLAVSRARAALDAGSGRVDRDPVASFGFLATVSERHGLKSTFYFQAGTGPGDEDFRYSLTDAPFASVLQDLHARGHSIGLHGSFGSYASAGRLAHEARALRDRCRELGIVQDDFGNRQHYLRFRVPDTWRHLAAAGLAHDSSMGFADAPGFRSSTCREHDVFDVVERRPLGLRERPLAVMDVTLLGYQGLDWPSAADSTKRVAAEARRRNGTLVLLVHNDTVAGDRARGHYRELVEELAS